MRSRTLVDPRYHRSVRTLAILVIAGCHGAPQREPPVPAIVAPPRVPAAPTAPPPAQVTYGCDAPEAACAQLRAALPGSTWVASGAQHVLHACGADAHDRVGEWRYALVAPLLSPTEDVTTAELTAMWRGTHKLAITASAATRTALAALGTAAGEPSAPAVDAKHWAIVPVDELVPHWKVVTIDGHHPFTTDALDVPLCLDVAAKVKNLDPDALTTVAMTGVTAMTRFTAKLMDERGVTFPARDIASWFAGVDVVHVSNEVSFVPDCKPKLDGITFCSREKYIELLETLHPQIIELDGSHLPDYGREWIGHTLDMYAARGWRWFGGGRDQIDGTKPLLLEHHGNKLAFVGCNMPWTTAKVIYPGAGVAACDIRRLDWQVRDLRDRGYLPIVAIQHDEVYSHVPPDGLVRDFRHFADVGAAIVFGSQAHCAHPWEVVHGAFVHYGPGNFFFDQEATNTRDAANDLFYFYQGRLLTVGHLYTRIEDMGRPRPMKDRERREFLREMATALGKLPRTDAWTAPRVLPAAHERPDSFLIKNRVQPLLVFAPTGADAAKKYPLVIDLHDAHLAGGPLEKLLARGMPRELEAAPEKTTSFVASPHLALGGQWTPALVDAVKVYMIAKYPIDPTQIEVRAE